MSSDAAPRRAVAPCLRGGILSTYDTRTNGPDSQTGQAPDSAAGKAQDRAQEAASQAQEKAQQAAGQARSRVRDEVDTRSTQAGHHGDTRAQDGASAPPARRKPPSRRTPWRRTCARSASTGGRSARTSPPSTPTRRPS